MIQKIFLLYFNFQDPSVLTLSLLVKIKQDQLNPNAALQISFCPVQK